MTLAETFKYVFHSGKNSRLRYLAGHIASGLWPNAYFRHRRNALLRSLDERPDKAYILDRVDYYCRINNLTPLSENAKMVGDFRRKGHRSNYFFDSFEFVRYFPKRMRWKYIFGDVRDLQDEPTIVKSRPIGNDNQNSVLLNLDKVRHFIFLKDRLSFSDKENRIVFRGDIWYKPWRIALFERWFGHPRCDLGEFGQHPVNPDWQGGMLTLYDHLRFKFVCSIEGYDVASNLKWVMSSNSLAVMPKPKFETWFMEGRLEPNVHYVEVKPDYSDLIEKMDYYATHTEEAEAIIHRAHAWISQFKDKKRERLIALLVLDKYRRMTGQTDIE